jgi:acetoin utilization protein AcuB
MKVERWMSSPAITVTPDIPASLALRKMMEYEIRRLPVVDEDGGLVGLVTDRDLRGIVPPASMPHPSRPYEPAADDPPVRDAMRKAIAVVTPRDSIRDVARLMHDLRVTGLPVVEGRRCVGVITVQDLLEVLVAALDAHLNEVNEEIRDRETSGPAPHRTGAGEAG